MKLDKADAPKEPGKIGRKPQVKPRDGDTRRRSKRPKPFDASVANAMDPKLPTPAPTPKRQGWTPIETALADACLREAEAEKPGRISERTAFALKDADGVETLVEGGEESASGIARFSPPESRQGPRSAQKNEAAPRTEAAQKNEAAPRTEATQRDVAPRAPVSSSAKPSLLPVDRHVDGVAPEASPNLATGAKAHDDDPDAETPAEIEARQLVDTPEALDGPTFSAPERATRVAKPAPQVAALEPAEPAAPRAALGPAVAMARTGEAKVEIDHPSLGKVAAYVKASAKGLDVTLTASSVQGVAALRESRAALRKKLENEGDAVARLRTGKRRLGATALLDDEDLEDR